MMLYICVIIQCMIETGTYVSFFLFSYKRNKNERNTYIGWMDGWMTAIEEK